VRKQHPYGVSARSNALIEAFATRSCVREQLHGLREKLYFVSGHDFNRVAQKAKKDWAFTGCGKTHVFEGHGL